MTFSAATTAWLDSAFAAPTIAQTQAWAAIAEGHHTLVIAPTGSGKTLAAFLWAIDQQIQQSNADSPPSDNPPTRSQILYISPLKALASDVERNLRAPLTGITHYALQHGEMVPEVTIGVRTGDTTPAERRRMMTTPPDIVITTPESLFLMLTSGARSALANVGTVIIDEIHALVGTKRGAHLALSLERLDELVESPVQRIGLSATVTPPDVVGRYLTGTRTVAEGGRELTVVQPPAKKHRVVDVEIPVPDLTDLPALSSDDDLGLLDDGPDLSGDATRTRDRASLWPHIERRIVDLITSHRSTIVFTNSRGAAERLTAHLNEEWQRRHAAAEGDTLDRGAVWPAAIPGQSGTSTGAPAVIARAHHGSLSRSERTRTEEELKAGLLPAVVSTSSLELGIDMGAVDLVILVGSPPSVASGLQRIGRAGHGVGETSHGIIFPTHRGDLLPSAVIATRMLSGELEQVKIPSHPLDVLAQHIVAILAVEEWSVDDLLTVIRRSASYEHLGEATYRSVLDMLAGRYPSEDFAELRPRIMWDRTTDQLTARPGAKRLAIVSGGTIPDRGLYPVVLPEGKEAAAGRPRRVAELDEEMVYESRAGDTITLGTSTWRIEEITPQQVIVTPAPGQPGRLPFWKGDGPGRPYELGRAIGEWTRKLDYARDREPDACTQLLDAAGLNPYAQDNTVALVAEQRAATGKVPDDKTIIVEKFRDEIGDWRWAIHSPFGSRVHAPWAMIISGRVKERFGLDASVYHSDDGIALRLPPTGDGDDVGLDIAELLIDPANIHAEVRQHVTDSVMFAARFREAAARALLLPRYSPDRRQPLWQQRHRAAQLLAVAAQYPDFPIVLEAIRECLQDDMDLDAFTTIMGAIESGSISLLEVTTQSPSPFARSLLFSYVGQFLYDSDAPLAERRAAALSLDQTLLNEILGTGSSPALGELLNQEIIAQVSAEVARLAPDRKVTTLDGVWDLLRTHGPLTQEGIEARCDFPDDAETPLDAWLNAHDGRLVMSVRMVGRQQWAALDDAARLRDGLGVPLPPGLPLSYLEAVPDPLGDLVRRHARTHGPFTADEVAQRYGLPIAVVQDTIRRLSAGHFIAAGPARVIDDAHQSVIDTFIDADVLRRIRRRSLAALRGEVEAVSAAAYARFLSGWHQFGQLRGADGLLGCLDQLAGCRFPASALETHILPTRVIDYTPTLLDAATARGDVLWCAHQRLPGSRHDAVISLHPAETAELTLPLVGSVGEADEDTLGARLMELLTHGGHFFDVLVQHTGATPRQTAEALWDLAWRSRVTSDSLAGLRLLIGAKGGAHKVAKQPATPRALSTSRGLRGLRGLRSAAMTAGTGGTSATTSATTSSTEPLVAAAQAAGRWSALPQADADGTIRAHADAMVLLQRYGVATRNLANDDAIASASANVTKVFNALEDDGQVRRGYFVEGLGGAQYAARSAVDELRQAARPDEKAPMVWLLAATDPANPYGSVLPWPEQPDPAVTHRPGRKAGASVVLINGHLAAYLEKGGSTLLVFPMSDDDDTPDSAHSSTPAPLIAETIVNAVGDRTLPRIIIKRINNTEIFQALTDARRLPAPDDSPATTLTRALLTAGAKHHLQGLRIEASRARR